MLSVVFALFDVFNSIFLENVENTNNNKRETDNKHSSNNSDKSTNSLNIIADTSIAPLDIRRFSSFLDSNKFILPFVVRITVEISLLEPLPLADFPEIECVFNLLHGVEGNIGFTSKLLGNSFVLDESLVQISQDFTISIDNGLHILDLALINFLTFGLLCFKFLEFSCALGQLFFNLKQLSTVIANAHILHVEDLAWNTLVSEPFLDDSLDIIVLVLEDLLGDSLGSNSKISSGSVSFIDDNGSFLLNFSEELQQKSTDNDGKEVIDHLLLNGKLIISLIGQTVRQNVAFNTIISVPLVGNIGGDVISGKAVSTLIVGGQPI